MRSIIFSNLGSGIGLIPDYLRLGHHGGRSGTAILVLASAFAYLTAVTVGASRRILEAAGETTGPNLPSSFDA